jgi:hypothetical protein
MTSQKTNCREIPERNLRGSRDRIQFSNVTYLVIHLIFKVFHTVVFCLKMMLYIIITLYAILKSNSSRMHFIGMQYFDFCADSVLQSMRVSVS